MSPAWDRTPRPDDCTGLPLSLSDVRVTLQFPSEAPWDPPPALHLPRTPCSHHSSGLPVSLKDQIEVKGTEFTMSYVGWVGKVAEHDAVIAELLLKQGVSGDL